MKIILFFGVCFLVFYLLFRASDWADSENGIKQNVGCTVMALALILGLLITIYGFIKSCSDDNGPSYEYYDAPRK